MNNLELDDLRLCCAIADSGSLRKAADVLRWSPSSVTKRLALLEQRIGQKLFIRSTRALRISPQGSALCERARALLAQWDELLGELTDAQDALAGQIRLVSSFGFGRRCLGPSLTRFSKAHPKLDIQLTLRDQLPDLVSHQFDAAVWLWEPTTPLDTSLSAKVLAQNQRVLVAAPSYLQTHGTPQALRDLQNHACLRVQEHSLGSDTWTMQRIDQAKAPPEQVRVTGPLMTNSGELALDWCLAGRGIALRSLWDAAAHINSGRLKHVLPEYSMTNANVQWITPFGVTQSKRLRLLAEHLQGDFAQADWLSLSASA